MSNEQKVETAADLRLHPTWTTKDDPAYPKLKSGLTREQAIMNAWLEQAGEDCPDCDVQMSHNGAPGRRPALVRVDPAKRPTLDNVRVTCSGCLGN